MERFYPSLDWFAHFAWRNSQGCFIAAIAVIGIWFLRRYSLTLAIKQKWTTHEKALSNAVAWDRYTMSLQGVALAAGVFIGYVGLFGVILESVFRTRSFEWIRGHWAHYLWNPNLTYSQVSDHAMAASLISVFLAPVLAILILLVIHWSLFGEPTDYGKAEFFTPDQFFDNGPTVAYILGRRGGIKWRRDCPSTGRYQLFPVGASALAEMMLVLGPSGSGKTSNIFGHILISSKVPTIYQDQKGTMPGSETNDKPAWGFDSGSHSRSGVLNFMDEIHDNAMRRMLCEAIIPARPNDKNEWIYSLARSVLNAILAARDWPDLGSVWASISHHGLKGAADQLPTIWAELLLDPKVLSWVGIEMKPLEIFLDPAVAKITCGPSTVSLQDFRNLGGYVLGDCAVTEYDLVRRMFWLLLFGTLRSRKNQALSLIILMDEGGDAGRIAQLSRTLNLYRSKGVSLVFGIQNDSFLKEVYGESYETVKDSLNRWITCCYNANADFFHRLQGKYGSFTKKVSKGLGSVSEKFDFASNVPWHHFHQNRGVLLQQSTMLGNFGGVPVDLEHGSRPQPSMDLPIPVVKVLPLRVDSTVLDQDEAASIAAGYERWKMSGEQLPEGVDLDTI